MSAASHPEQPRPQIELIAATPEHQPILANLLELYIHDFSEFLSIELGEDGRFGFPDLPLYWSESDRYPFLVRIDGNLAGLVFVTRGAGISTGENVWDMAQFFVVRGYRRRGIGTRIAHEVWKRFPGQWEVRVMEPNLPALQFWQRAVTEFTGKAILPVPYETDGEERFLFSFESVLAAATRATASS